MNPGMGSFHVENVPIFTSPAELVPAYFFRALTFFASSELIVLEICLLINYVYYAGLPEIKNLKKGNKLFKFQALFECLHL